jgi:hypothetical protein
LPLLLLAAAAAPAPHAPPPAQADAAGNRMAAFSEIASLPADDGPAGSTLRNCTTDGRWCARLHEDEAGANWWLELSEGAAAARRFVVAGVHDEESAFAVWPHIVIEDGGAVLVGVEATKATGYSGGGASATRLIMVRAKPGAGALRQVLDLPLRASKDIRACFGPRDMRRRRGACSDQYEFFSALTLDPTTRAGRPRFVYVTRARTYPGRRTLGEDSTAAPPLRPADVRWAADPVCSYRRAIAFDLAQLRYMPNRPLPACADYLDF